MQWYGLVQTILKGKGIHIDFSGHFSGIVMHLLPSGQIGCGGLIFIQIKSQSYLQSGSSYNYSKPFGHFIGDFIQISPFGQSSTFWHPSAWHSKHIARQISGDVQNGSISIVREFLGHFSGNIIHSLSSGQTYGGGQAQLYKSNGSSVFFFPNPLQL